MESTEKTLFKKQIERELIMQKRKSNFLFIVVLGLLLLVSNFYLPKKVLNFNTIKAKEIIVEDDNGNDIVVISANITSTESRTRTDTLTGVLVLDKNGNDRVLLGASPSVNIDGKIIKRSINGPYGIAFNDENGTEKGGLGYYEDRGLSILGLDGPSGEGIVLFVPQKESYGQKVGIIINDPQKGGQLFYIGASTKGERIFNMDAQEKGRFSILMDSSSSTNIKYYDYINKSETDLLNTK